MMAKPFMKTCGCHWNDSVQSLAMQVAARMLDSNVARATHLPRHQALQRVLSLHPEEIARVIIGAKCNGMSVGVSNRNPTIGEKINIIVYISGSTYPPN